MKLAHLAVLAAALAGGPARAERVTTAELQGRMEALMPQVEAVAGRAFFERPRLTIASRQEVLAVDAEVRRKYLGPEAETDAWTRQIVGRAVAIYLPSTATIYVIGEAVERLFQVHEHSAALLRPALDCLIAHELTHALQDQHLPLLRDEASDALLASLVMREGQANLLMHDVCRDPVTDHLLSAVQGIDSLSSQDPSDPDIYTYGYGERFTSVLRDRYGSPGLWWAMAQPAPSRAEVEAVVGPTLLPGWRDPAPLVAEGARLAGGEDWTTSAGPMSAFSLVEALNDDVRDGGGPTADAGLYWQADLGDRQVTLLAFAMPDAGVASGWVERRRRQLDTAARVGTSVHLLSPSLLALQRLRTRPTAGARALPGSAVVAAVGLGDGERYAEEWVASGRRLLGIAGTNVRLRGGAPDLVMQRLLAALPGAPVEPEKPSEEVLARWAPPATLPPVAVSLEYQVRAALWDSERGAFNACASRALEAPSAPGEARDALVLLGYGCALQADDLATSERLGAALGPRSVVPVELRLNHARLLLNARRVAEARQILDGIQQVDPPLREGLASLRLWVASAQRDRRALAAAAVDPALPATIRLQAAEFLIHLGAWSDAARVLRGTCRELTGAERGRCDALYDDARP